MYSYETERPWIFTDAGQRTFLRIRDRVAKLLAQSGAVRMAEAISGETGSVWQHIACVDRMVELGEILELSGREVAGQYRIFIATT